MAGTDRKTRTWYRYGSMVADLEVAHDLWVMASWGTIMAPKQTGKLTIVSLLLEAVDIGHMKLLCLVEEMKTAQNHHKHYHLQNPPNCDNQHEKRQGLSIFLGTWRYSTHPHTSRNWKHQPWSCGTDQEVCSWHKYSNGLIIRHQNIFFRSTYGVHWNPSLLLAKRIKYMLPFNSDKTNT